MGTRKPLNLSAARARLFATLLPAAIGCFCGFLYAERAIPAETPEASGLYGMYATLGAVVGILIMRVGGLVYMIIRDFGEPRS